MKLKLSVVYKAIAEKMEDRKVYNQLADSTHLLTRRCRHDFVTFADPRGYKPTKARLKDIYYVDDHILFWRIPDSKMWIIEGFKSNYDINLRILQLQEQDTYPSSPMARVDNNVIDIVNPNLNSSDNSNNLLYAHKIVFCSY